MSRHRLTGRLRRNDDFQHVARWCDEQGFEYVAVMKGRLSHPKVQIVTDDGVSFHVTVASSGGNVAGGLIRQKLRQALDRARSQQVGKS